MSVQTQTAPAGSETDTGMVVDHIAIAVLDLENAVAHFRDRLGFEIMETRETRGETTNMRSTVVRRGKVTFVLLASDDPASQIGRFLARGGPGVHHIALHVDGIGGLVANLEREGVAFSTGLIGTPSLKQRFTTRDGNSRLMLEFIERGEFEGFDDANVEQLFRDMERSDSV